MDEGRENHIIMSVMVTTNCVLSFLFLLVATYASHCILAREDRRQEEEGGASPFFLTDQSKHGKRRALKSRLYNVVTTTTTTPTPVAAGNTPNTPLSITLSWSFSFGSDAPAATNADVVPLLSSIRESSRNASQSHSNGSASVPGMASGSFNSGMVPSSSHQRSSRTNWSIFRDPKSVLFMLAICCSLTQAVTALTLTLANPNHLLLKGNRRNQDLIASPQAFLLLLYFTVLCILLHKLGDTNGNFSTKKFCIIVWGSVATLVALMTTSVVLVLTEAIPVALEVFSAVCQGTLALSFFATAVILPKRIVRYGESLSPVALKIRRVTLTTAFSLLVRLIILLPVVQNSLSVVGVFAPSIFFVFSIIPVAASIHLLHYPK